MFDYFWLICGLWVGVGGALAIRGGLKKRIIAGEYSREEVDTFARQYALWIVVPSVLLWLLQVSTEPRGTFEFLGWPQPQKAAAVGMLVLLWGALAYYVFLRDGAERLARYLGGPFSILHTPSMVKVVTVLVILSGVAALLHEA